MNRKNTNSLIRVKYDPNRKATIIENMVEYGKIQSGKCTGDPLIYNQFLQKIKAGSVVSNENDFGKHIETLENNLEEIKSENEKLTEKISKYNADIEDKKGQITRKKDELDELEINHNKGIPVGDRFNPLMYNVYIACLLIFGFFAYYFYLSLFERALTGSEFGDGSGIGVDFFLTIEEIQNLKHKLLLLAPSLIFIFGVALHYFLSMKNKLKYIAVGMVILITFTLDWFMSKTIHYHQEGIKKIFDEKYQIQDVWSSDIFFILIIVGFIGYLFWSIIFHALMEENKKKDPTGEYHIRVKQIQQKIRDLKDEIGSEQKNLKTDSDKTEANKIKISELQNQLDNGEIDVNMQDMSNSIENFTTGWLSFITGDNFKPMREDVINYKNDFVGNL